ncbi:pseudouridylate synthase TRUB2, mitochondrial [Apodemus sylvaticus]|uniref:pseudouridylate synthase TRUB2, mitochondrial n=1 Tax=Apodemus sylvaticus TaxID=10129 RepID=UPI0022441E9B|nr:pseudouridylate synthase TRUB2, mitochondrial [Apodemus sylvaticus]
MGSSGLARLQGLFAVYKPPGLKWLHVRETVELQLLKGLNAQQPPAPKQRLRFLLGPVEGSEEKKLTLRATSVPSLTSHRLVRGPAFTNLKIGVGHRLDVQASGVLVLAVGHGRSLLTDISDAHLTKDYTVRGLLGKATDNFCEDGRLIEKTTYDHVTRERLDRILAMIQGSHQKALVTYSNLDLKSQEAYEMAVRGVIRPMSKSPMLITAIRCLHFAPPEFLLEVQCVHETQQQLRKLVHEIGLELKSTAVCTQVRRTRDGLFGLDDALLRTQWDLHNIQGAIQATAPRVAVELKKNLTLKLGPQQLPSAGPPWGLKGPSSTLELGSCAGQ